MVHEVDLERPESLSDAKPAHQEFERVQRLDDLPDPDVGKSDEERAAIDKKLMRKVDWMLIPWLSLLYLLSFLDRTNIGNARLAGMEEDLGMSGRDYNLSLTIFFITYALFEPLTNTLLKRLTPRIFFTGIIITWGVIMTLMGLVKNFSGLLAARFFLGIAEAGLFPGVNYYLSCWYKGSEIGVRSALFFSAAAIAGSFGGLLAAAIAKMDGISGMPGWAWIFIIEGLATLAIGLGCWWMVFDWPETASFLSADDKVRIQRRILADKQAPTAEDFDKRHIYSALRDWKTYGYMVIYMGCLIPLYAFSLFLPTILRGMNYTGTHAQLLSVPPYAVAAVCTVSIGFFADRTRWRGYCNIGVVLVGISGFVMLISSSNPKIQYAGTFLGAAGIYPTIANTLSWVINNTEGSLKRAVTLGMVVGWGNLTGVVSSNIFLVQESPRFWTGHGVILASQCLFLLGGSVFMHLMLRSENKKRANGGMDEKWAAMSQEQQWFSGDKRPDFIYTL
ncbi:major facilitator superfamily transporter [Dactylonectria macrodidyma]|uniref:Major facilitator superfamily transporter n=1 Tax=Dactylonectria macrodidyma TaxID=307937 RepID=A0A9P9FGV3_9HYPO|nr:major facilitator superfamily transporter [Dactylonectria macrodidyma]